MFEEWLLERRYWLGFTSKLDFPPQFGFALRERALSARRVADPYRSFVLLLFFRIFLRAAALGLLLFFFLFCLPFALGLGLALVVCGTRAFGVGTLRRALGSLCMV